MIDYMVARAPLIMLIAAIAFYIVVSALEYYAIWKRAQKKFKEMDSTLIIREMTRQGAGK